MERHATGVRATTVAPFHYHSLAVQSGTATLARFMPDRTLSFAVQNAFGGLAPSPALPTKDYGRDLRQLAWFASVFEADEARLLKPLGRRLNIDCEGGLQRKVITATSSGNLKTWFSIQEVAPGVVFRGALFGPDPFEMASNVSGRPIDHFLVRVGRHLGGLLRIEREPVERVRLNLHTAVHIGAAPDTYAGIAMETYALHDLQLSAPLPVGEASRIVSRWMQ